MGRAARIDVPDNWYHVIARGQRREALFLDDRDKRRYLALLDEVLQRHRADLSAYCLMSNHVHLLIFRRDRSLGQIFRQAHIQYANYFNARHEKVGYVFQGRFRSSLVLSESYLAAVIRYIHLNPVDAGICRSAEDFAWSSDSFYRAGELTAGVTLRKAPGFDGTQGMRRYAQMMAADAGADRGMGEGHGQLIGKAGEEKGIDRRKKSRSRWNRPDRREGLPLKSRLRDLLRQFNLAEADVVGASRTRTISHPRQILMARLYEEGYQPSEIAAHFLRTPAAVLSAFRHRQLVKQ